MKTCDILNIDCFGNVSVVTRATLEPMTHTFDIKFGKQMMVVLEELLALIEITIECPNVHSNIKNSLAMPIKKIQDVIHNFGKIKHEKKCSSSSNTAEKNEEQAVIAEIVGFIGDKVTGIRILRNEGLHDIL